MRGVRIRRGVRSGEEGCTVRGGGVYGQGRRGVRSGEEGCKVRGGGV